MCDAQQLHDPCQAEGSLGGGVLHLPGLVSRAMGRQRRVLPQKTGLNARPLLAFCFIWVTKVTNRMRSRMAVKPHYFFFHRHGSLVLQTLGFPSRLQRLTVRDSNEVGYPK